LLDESEDAPVGNAFGDHGQQFGVGDAVSR
jgi:hypothetical protein